VDPEALPILAFKGSACRFIIPWASQKHLSNLGVADKQILKTTRKEGHRISDAKRQAFAKVIERLTVGAENNMKFE
jgi:hypothetical protein